MQSQSMLYYSVVLLITGGPGQDALILAAIASKAGLEVVVTSRSESGVRLGEQLLPVVAWSKLDVEEYEDCEAVLRKFKPQHVVNFAGHSSVADSWLSPTRTQGVNTTGCLNLLEALRKESPLSVFLQAGSSEMYSRDSGVVTSTTPYEPASPYGHSKAQAAQWVRFYNKFFGLACYNMILFNHESPLRGPEFVWKVIDAQIARSLQDQTDPIVSLSNPYAAKDWSWAPDLMSGILSNIVRSPNRDLVFASGYLTQLIDIVKLFARQYGLKDIKIEDAKGIRPNDQSHPTGDIAETQLTLDWHKRTSIESAVEQMVQFSDFGLNRSEALETKALWLSSLKST